LLDDYLILRFQTLLDGALQTLCARSASVGNTLTGFLDDSQQFTAELTAQTSNFYIA
jgi:hypothetical protein